MTEPKRWFAEVDHFFVVDCNSLTNITVEAEKLTGRATKTRAASIRREEAAANEPKRLTILQQLLAIEGEAAVMAPVIYSPKQLLMRVTLESDQRRKYISQIQGANTEELNAYAILAVGEKNMQLAAALCQHVGPLPKDQHPGFSANALAEVFAATPESAIWLRSDVPCKNLVSQLGWTPIAASEASDAPLRIPSVVARLAQAEYFERLLSTGEVQHRAELAQRYGLARSRVTQLMSLLKLDPRLVERVRTLEPGTMERLVTERKLRPLAKLARDEQLAEAANAMPKVFGELRA